MEEKRSEVGGTREQGFTGAPEVVRRGPGAPQRQQVSIVMPIVAAAVVGVVIVGLILAFHARGAKWRTFASTPSGMATYAVTLELPPGWDITEQGRGSQWGVRVVTAGPEEETAPGETRSMLPTGLQVTCTTIPQDQTFDQYMDVLARSKSMGLFQVKPFDAGGMPARLITLRQVQYQQLVYVCPEGKGKMYVLKLGCRPDEQAAMQPMFDRVIKSFRVKQ
jgi:hypothetical protein